MEAIPATGLADGRFRLVRLLGEGGMGRVYEAFDRDLRTQVAIKMMRHPSPEALLRIKGEFRALQEVGHDNLVRLGELFVDKDDCFFTMELVDGVDFLDHVLVRASRAGRSQASATVSTTRPSVRIQAPVDVWDADTLRLEVIYDETRLRAALRQVADGLAALHRAGKVHRDLKPSNILVARGEAGRADRAVLLDLGLSVDTGDRVAAGLIEGTIEYMAPEQASGAPAEPSADLYALGAVLYEALTGRPPFAGDVMSVIERKRRLDPTSPQTMFDGIPTDLDELCLALLRRDPARRPTAREVADGLGEAGRADWQRRGARPQRAEAPFVGRTAELAALRRALDDGAQRALVLLISGEAGVGKSALIRRFATELRGSGAQLLAGRCDARGVGAVPRLRRHRRRADPLAGRAAGRGARRDHAPDAALLSGLFRVFERLAPADGVVEESGLDVRARRRRAFAVLRELLTNVARRAPTALVIDDLQWIDADSVQLLEAVFALRPPPLLLIGLVVPGKDRPELLRAALAPLDVEVHELELGALRAAESSALVRSLVPDGDDATVARLADAGRGSPLFLEQMAAAVVDGKEVPATLEGVLWARIAELEDASRAVLDVVTVAGLPIDLGTVARATGQPRQELAQALAQLEALRLVRTTGARRNDLVEPYHETVRQAVRATLTPEQARHRHRVLADALEKRAAAPWLVFHHLLAAGEPALAAPFAVEAAVRARRELSARRVARLCRVALELLPDGDAARGELCRAYAVALANAGQGADAAHWYLEAARTISGVDGIELRRRAADHLLRCGRIDDGMTVVREVLAEVGVSLPTGGREAMTSLLWRRARVRLRGLRGTRSSAAGVRDPAAMLRADVCLSFGMSLSLIDTIAGANLHALGALDAMRLGDPDRLARALAAEAGYTAIGGTRVAARTARLLAEAEVAARRASSPLPAEMVRWVRGLSLFMQGRYGDALAALDEAVRGLAERCPGQIWEQTSAELFAAWALSHLGRLDELESRLGELRRSSHWNDDRYTGSMARAGNCVLPLLAADRPGDAHAQIELAQAQWAQAGFQMQHMMVLLGNIETDLYAGDAATAAARLAECQPRIEQAMILRIQHTRLVHLDLQGRVALAGGDRGKLGLIADGARRALREGAPWAQGSAYARLAAVAAAQGRPEAAHELLVRAGDALAEAGIALVAAAVRLRIAALHAEDLPATAAWAELKSAGVLRPDRWMEMYAPWLP